MGHVGVGWVMHRRESCRGGVGWVMQGWGGSCRGGMSHVGVEWVMQGWGGSCSSGVGHVAVGWVM